MGSRPRIDSIEAPGSTSKPASFEVQIRRTGVPSAIVIVTLTASLASPGTAWTFVTRAFG